MKIILVVDDNEFVSEALALRLNLFIKDSRVITAPNGAEAVSVLDREPVDFVLTDLQMPVMNGYELIEYCRKNHRRVPLSAMTGEYTPDVLKRLCTLGVHVCFEKPFDYDEVAHRVREELDNGQSVLGPLSGRLAAAFGAVRRG